MISELFIVSLLSTAAIALAVVIFIQNVYIKARLNALENAPVLRQYVERYVPYDNSPEAQRNLEEKMKASEKEFEESLGLMPTGRSDRRRRNETNILRAEELV